MRKILENSNTGTKPPELPDGLFGSIMVAIEREDRLRRLRRRFAVFSLLAISCAAVPLSVMLLLGQANDSGITYFISTAAGDFGTSLVLWKYFSINN